MEQEERDKILNKEGNEFATSNIPISMWQNDKGKFYPVIAMPRKESCCNCEDEPFETEKEFKEYCDRAIAIYENAVELFKLLKEHKIDHIYYFDSPKKYLEVKKREELKNEGGNSSQH